MLDAEILSSWQGMQQLPPIENDSCEQQWSPGSTMWRETVLRRRCRHLTSRYASSSVAAKTPVYSQELLDSLSSKVGKDKVQGLRSVSSKTHALQNAELEAQMAGCNAQIIQLTAQQSHDADCMSQLQAELAALTERSQTQIKELVAKVDRSVLQGPVPPA